MLTADDGLAVDDEPVGELVGAEEELEVEEAVIAGAQMVWFLNSTTESTTLSLLLATKSCLRCVSL